MKKLESFKNGLFVKELTKSELKLVKGSKIAPSGTRTKCSNTGNCLDCEDSDGVD